jgi:hypothetical protein
MDSQEVKNAISGVLVVDKPVGMTSHDVVQAIRTGTGLRRAGHTGTLDPRASGVLVILVGPAVRLSEFVSASDKRYQAIIRLGSTTDTFDADGKFTHSEQPVNVTEDQFEKVLSTFIGEKPCHHHRRIDRTFTKSFADRVFDRDDLLRTYGFAIQIFPNFDRKVDLVFGGELHRKVNGRRSQRRSRLRNGPSGRRRSPHGRRIR